MSAAFSLVQDQEGQRKSKKLLHQRENSANLGQVEKLLKDLFLDVGKAKKLKHPQISEIDSEYVSDLFKRKRASVERHYPNSVQPKFSAEIIIKKQNMFVFLV